MKKKYGPPAPAKNRVLRLHKPTEMRGLSLKGAHWRCLTTLTHADTHVGV